MVGFIRHYKGKSHQEVDDLGVPPFQETTTCVLMTTLSDARHRAAAVTGSGEIPFDGSCKDMRSPGP